MLRSSLTIQVPLDLTWGAVSGRVSVAAPVQPACVGLNLSRLALVTLTCLLVVTISFSTTYRYSKLVFTLCRRPAITLSPARTPLEHRSLSPYYPST